ncbi:MAG TPA: PmoA family protein [Bacteroidales bacterium]|nr:PmoA family protein [Bacteroidales bacterium]HOK74331.1 PmoA family protein [Bacteroidales bacterium]HOM39854.1 PmoA family protein [Bacteroidales bacterium]HOU30014.1 PmoA family protein [Bacteroidales bacterium]HPP92795.1 PmoA family protein [Bacteroidales bacterium]
MRYLLITFLVLVNMAAYSQKVKLVHDEQKRKVDVFIGDKLFTSYCYPANLEKPFLFPVYAPNGAVVTRGFPLEPRKGERVDHPHHIGLWFNHGNVNGLDFWNNSSAIPVNRKDQYGHIVVKKIVKAKGGKTGLLEVVSEWKDNKENTVLTENTQYIFRASKTGWMVDHIATLTATNGPVTITDNKEGMFAIRVDRALEMPTNEPLIFTDEKGNPTTVKVMDNTGVTGMYVSSNGNRGDAVWGTRNKWVILSGKKDNVPVSLAIFDHPKNPGFPAYSHARGYGLFSVNNLGQKSYDPKQEEVVYKLAPGESMVLRHRFYIQSGSELTPEAAEAIFNDFSKSY